MARRNRITKRTPLTSLQAIAFVTAFAIVGGALLVFGESASLLGLERSTIAPSHRVEAISDERLAVSGFRLIDSALWRLSYLVPEHWLHVRGFDASQERHYVSDASMARLDQLTDGLHLSIQREQATALSVEAIAEQEAGRIDGEITERTASTIDGFPSMEIREHRRSVLNTELFSRVVFVLVDGWTMTVRLTAQSADRLQGEDSLFATVRDSIRVVK